MMNMLLSAGVNPSGFINLLFTGFYTHIVRLQLEYDLAINRLTISQLHALEKTYDARGKTSTRKLVVHSLFRTSPRKTVLPVTEEPDTRSLKAAKRCFFQQNLEILQRCRNSKKRSCCIRWRLGWLPGGKPRSCLKHPTQQLPKNRAICCLDMHRRLFMPKAICNPLSFLLNMLPLHQLHHNKLISTNHSHGQKLLVWLN
ncbi:hypothetical protein BCV71DRAFT_242879 [Rhizopus microsporus]|uniref:Uncharacterized protein n=1 Tax=Rhizopus microsporus TaxID=58291 RepID=A0A1X0S4V1_RHIZD|nr:hypothetical protein BCV71DRAFT_242879 [Rhizopus microsporus]